MVAMPFFCLIIYGKFILNPISKSVCLLNLLSKPTMNSIVTVWLWRTTIVVKNNETNDKFYRKVAFPRYTESVKFMSQS